MVVQATFLREWKQMLAELPTARILVFNGPGTIHSKVFTFDDRVAAIGSYNMDPMSEQINSEALCLIRSPEFARRMRLRIEQLLKNSTEWRIRRPGAGVMEKEVGPSPEAVAGALEVLKNADVLKLLRPML
jgi:phosphatidylserine/phosphatidylglycerophosphate/cardiolipin synthase-like enzyme